MVKRPPQLTYLNITKEFMNLVGERYVSPDKVLQAAERLGVRSIEEKIIVISVLRDAVRQVSLNKVYRSVQHRDELFGAIIEALEELEDQLDIAISQEEEKEEFHLPEDKIS